ncbi:MAG: protoporphyrinogen/coproporphyrinogen oxidase [Thermomicrobiales bacterium]|nr:protoporphyrinogen/coproporphyrinogen oxidase [Thermomicrobiales bacterium]
MSRPPLEMTTPAEQVDVAIVGGGIAGLCAAYRLRERAPELSCVLLEASVRLGGKVLTETIELESGRFVVEAGPDAFLAQKPWARQLAEELGLADQIIPINAVPQPVSVLKRGRPVALPAGVSLLAPTRTWPFLRSPLLSPQGKARVALDLVLPATGGNADESLAEFVRRRLGVEALDWIAEPLMAGIYNAEPEQLSLLATFPTFRQLERDHRSLIRGSRATARGMQGKPKGPAFLSLRGGMQELTDALVAKTAGMARCHTPVERVTRRAEGAFALLFADRPPIVAQALLMTVPAAEAARLLEPMALQATRELTGLRTVGAGAMTLAYRTKEVKRPLPGYGLVVPRRERRPINAITVASRKFDGRAPEGWELLRVFFGGARSPETMLLDEERLIAVVGAQLREILGIEAQPAFHRVYRWSSGSPQYDVGHLGRVAAIEDALPPGLSIAGGAYHGVGIPDIVRSMAATVDRIIIESSTKRRGETPISHEYDTSRGAFING